MVWTETDDGTVGRGLISALGGVAREIGEPDFHLRLFDLIGALLPHESGWIVRYSSKTEPDVLHTKEIGSDVVDYYLGAKPSAGDPYLRSWRKNAAARVETMDVALPLAPDRNWYFSYFMKPIQFVDEIGLFLPASDSSCMSLFFERRTERFTDDDIARLTQFFPTILEFHLSHMRSLLRNMSAIVGGCRSMEDSVAAVFDRQGVLVSATQKWREAERDDPSMSGLRHSASLAEIRDAIDRSSLPLNVVDLADMNPIAPRGLLVHLVDDAEFAARSADRDASTVVDRLTPRERDIMALTLEGMSTGTIAQRLGIAKGSIKNVRLRMYRKLGVASEREMMAMMAPFSNRLRLSLAR
ncbi:MAG: LuxR C-terminal-related transcriptional regulator [Hansschlegelia sp.]